jgi:hypothetical protein
VINVRDDGKISNQIRVHKNQYEKIS